MNSSKYTHNHTSTQSSHISVLRRLSPLVLNLMSVDAWAIAVDAFANECRAQSITMRFCSREIAPRHGWGNCSARRR